MKKKQYKSKNIQPITAFYERVSRHADGYDESTSITNQKKMVERYALTHNFTNFVHYTDDGYSGTSFDRPAWKQLMEDIYAGKVGTVITKDLSRIGRNYLEVGLLTDVVLPENNVRFIAIDNGVDSDRQESSEFTPFLNLINEFYVKQFSQRLRAAWKAKRIAGLHTATQCLYGYKKDPSNPDHWIVDEPAAAVVRRIYDLALEGKKYSEIANILYYDKVETPTYYRATHKPNGYTYQIPKKPYDWSPTSVHTILLDRSYCGCTINHKSTLATYKDTKSRILFDESEWQVIEGTQEAIISQETFDEVQRLISEKQIKTPYDVQTPLKGYIYCADCGEVMLQQKTRAFPVKNRKGEPTGKMTNPKNYFVCRTHRNANRHRENRCSTHHADTEALTLLVLEALRDVFHQAQSNRKGFLRQFQQSKGNSLDMKKALAEKQERQEKLDELIMEAYEANFKGQLTDE